jgi:hypothetical protein
MRAWNYENIRNYGNSKPSWVSPQSSGDFTARSDGEIIKGNNKTKMIGN